MKFNSMTFKPGSLFLFFLLAVLCSSGQSISTAMVQHVPGYFDANRPVAFGDSFVTTIKNNTASPVSFFVKYRKPGLEYLGYSDDSTSSILRQAKKSANPDSAMSDMLWEEANIIKSFLYHDGLLIAACTDSITLTKQCSVTGAYNSIYHQICGNFVQQAATDLHNADTTLFAWNNMRIANIDSGIDGHSVLEVHASTGWIMYDFLPGMPVFTVGASVAQIIADTSLLNESHIYLYDSVLLPGDQASFSDYKSQFTNATVNYSAPFESSYPESGIQILSPGSTLTYTGLVETLIVDTLQTQGKQFFTAALPVIIQAYSTGSNLLFDSLTSMVEFYYPSLTVAQATSVFADHGFPHFIIPPCQQWWQSPSSLFWHHTAPFKTLTIPASANPLIVGKNVRVGSYVMSASANNPVVVEDTSFQDMAETIWSAAIYAPMIAGNQLNYLDTGFIPANTTAAFTLSYNPERENPYYGFDLLNFSNDSLEITTQYFPFGNTTGNNIVAAKPGASTSVHPNPATGFIIVNGLEPYASVRIIDVLGNNLINTIADQDGLASINISNLSSGIYLANNIVFVKQ